MQGGGLDYLQKARLPGSFFFVMPFRIKIRSGLFEEPNACMPFGWLTMLSKPQPHAKSIPEGQIFQGMHACPQTHLISEAPYYSRASYIIIIIWC